MKKYTALFLALIMILALFSGCRGSGDAPAPAETKAIPTTEAPPTGETRETVPTEPAESVETSAPAETSEDPINSEPSVTGNEPDAVTEPVLDGGDHNHDFEVKVVPATCTADGYTEKTCKICGEVIVTDTTSALGHDWQKQNTVAPTCSTQGYTVYRCSRCGETKQDDVKCTVDHNWVKNGSRQPTCTEKGYTEYLCQSCGRTMTSDPVPALGHDWKQTEKKTPTCTSEGYEKYKCNRCGATETRNKKSALGHDWKFVKTVEPSESSEGYDLYQCSRCDAKERRNVKPKKLSCSQAEAAAHAFAQSKGFVIDYSLNANNSTYSFPNETDADYILSHGGQTWLNNRTIEGVQYVIDKYESMYPEDLEGLTIHCWVEYRAEYDSYRIWVFEG